MPNNDFPLKTFQYDFTYSTVQFPAMIAGWATGKTLCGIQRALFYSENIPNNLGVIFRKEYVDLRDSTVQDFEKYTQYKVNSQRDVIFDNGSKIMFRHIEELNNIQNINLGWFMIEQVDELETDKEFYMLWGRLRRQLQPTKEFIQSKLPERSGFVIGNVGQEWVKHIWKDNPKPNYDLVEATTLDNADVLPADYIQNIKQLETEKPEIYQRFVMNDWSVADDAFILIPMKYIEALKNIHYYDTIVGEVIASDPSAGGDECANYVLRNNRIIDSKFMYEKDTMKVAGELMVLGARHNIVNFAIDNIGVGKGICDRLSELKKTVIEIGSAESATGQFKHQFYNRRTEMWWYMMRRIMDKELPYPQDAELRRQLSSVKYKVVNSNGQIALEPKAETKRRLGRSPDRADAYVYGIWATQFTNPRNQIFKPYNYRTGKPEDKRRQDFSMAESYR